MRGWRSPRTSTWSPVRFARQSAVGHRRGQSLALVVVAAMVTACASFAPLYDRAMQQALVDTLLARASVGERAVTVQSDATVDAGGATESWDPRELRALVPQDVAQRLGPLVLGRSAFVTPVAGDVPPTGALVWRAGACEHVRLSSGTCPAAAGEILVSAADVERFGLTLGSTPTVAPAEDGPGVRLEVVGTYAPGDTSWWQGLSLVGHSMVSDGPDPSAAHDAWLTTEATFTDAAVLPGETSQAGALVPTDGTGVDELLALGDRTRDLARDARAVDGDVHVLTGLGDLTDDVRAQTRQAHRTVPLLMTPLAVLLVFVLWLVLAAATEQRRAEVAVARLRGRGPAGAAGVLLVELLPVLLVGVLPGAAAALLGGALTRALLPGNAPFEAGPGFAAAVLLAVVALALTTVAAAVRVARQPLDTLIRSGPPPSRRSLGALDAVAIAVVGTGVVAFLTGSLTGSLALAGPTLLALLVGLVLAQLAGPTAGAVGRRLLTRGRLVAGLTLLGTGRRREARAVIAVVTVATALAVFSLDADAIGARNRDNASRHDAGAPVVLRLASRDLDGVREALDDADPTGRRATPVVVVDSTLAVEPDAFRRIAFFPRGGPSDAEWRAIAPPAADPVTLRGSRISLTVGAGRGLTAQDIFGKASEVSVDLAVTSGSGTRRTVSLGVVPPSGRRTTLVGNDPACAAGCRLASVQLVAASGVEVQGDLELGDLRVDGRPVDLRTSAGDWNTTQDERTVIRPTGTSSAGVLRLALSIRGFYPAEITPAWVPRTVPALLPVARDDESDDLVVTGVDGSDRTATAVGRVVLVPGMPRRSALVDLDAISRGSAITFDAAVEVWLLDDPGLVAAVDAALREGGIAVTDVRRHSTIQQTYQDSVATWSLALGAVVGPVVVLIALLVLLVLAVTGWRDRARDLAVLRLNGADRRTVRRLAVWSQLPAVTLAVVAGVGAGLVGAALAMPDVAFFPAPPTTPVVDASTSWAAVLVAAVACAVVLPAAAVSGWVVARRAHLERVREVV